MLPMANGTRAARADKLPLASKEEDNILDRRKKKRLKIMPF